MKWIDDPGVPPPQTPDAQLRRLFHTVREHTTLPLKAVDAESVADALHVFLRERGAEDPESNQILGLSVRTLDELGADRAARLLLMFGSGLVRSARWEVSGEGHLWTLDLLRLVSEFGTPLELALFRLLDASLISMSEVWDSSSGRGRLGFRQVNGMMTRLFAGRSLPERPRKTFCRELILRSRERLEHLARSRHWSAVPEVLLLD